MEIYSESEDVIKFVLSFALPLIVIIASIAVPVIFGAGAWAAVKKFAKQARKYVDQPTDTIVVTIDGIGEWILHRELDAEIISKLLTATCDQIADSREVPYTDPRMSAGVRAELEAMLDKSEGIPLSERELTEDCFERGRAIE